jgi:tight adherence protein B
MMRRVGLVAAALALAVPAAVATAATEIRDIDATAYPEMRLTVVLSSAGTTPPTLREGNADAAGLQAENLGRAKSVVLAIDRSVSMQGQPLEDAIAAARAFVSAKPPADRIAITTFATESVLLTDFSTGTTDADTALRSIAVNPVQGTTLYDALVLSAEALAAEPLPGRVIIAVTDGNETRSEASLEDAIAAAQDAGASVYVVGIESKRFTPEPLKQLADETGGSYYGAASSEALAGVYQSIAEELRRTWQLRYFTAARPGEELTLEARAPGGEIAEATFEVPGVSVATPKSDSPVLPKRILEGWWGALALGGAVATLVLLALVFALAAPRGSWLKARLGPHLGDREREVKQRRERERFAVASGLFHATERTLGHLRFWRKLQDLLDRADMPLRTVEFLYLMSGSALIVGLVAAVIGPPMPLVLAALAVGALIPYGFVLTKARRRLKAFDAQLPDLLTTIAASLKAGHSFRQGIQAVVDEGQEPASSEFRRVLAETRLGRPMDGALAEMSRRVGSKNLEFVLTAVTIQRQVGGSLASIFDMVAETVRNRHQFARKVKSLTAMGRASAYVLIGLPFFVLGAVTLINAEYMGPLFHTSTGHKMMMIGAGMILFGSLILKKIVSFRG